MDLDRPHSGGSNNSVHFIQSLAELKDIVSREKHPEVSISIFRAKEYPIRGLFDESLPGMALSQIPDGQDFRILSPGYGRDMACDKIGCGDSHHQVFVVRFLKYSIPQLSKNRAAYPPF